jgi:hypothetical protein
MAPQFETLTFLFEFERGKTMRFEYQVRFSDPTRFHRIPTDLFSKPLMQSHCEEVFRVHPELRANRHDTEQGLNGLFNTTMVFKAAMRFINDEYKVFWV